VTQEAAATPGHAPGSGSFFGHSPVSPAGGHSSATFPPCACGRWRKSIVQRGWSCLVTVVTRMQIAHGRCLLACAGWGDVRLLPLVDASGLRACRRATGRAPTRPSQTSPSRRVGIAAERGQGPSSVAVSGFEPAIVLPNVSISGCVERSLRGKASRASLAGKTGRCTPSPDVCVALGWTGQSCRARSRGTRERVEANLLRFRCAFWERFVWFCP